MNAFLTNLTNSMKSLKPGTWKIGMKNTMRGLGMKAVAVRPEVMLIVGIVAVAAGTIDACLQTEKAKKVIKETKEETQKIEQTLKLEVPEGVEVMPETVKQLKMERGRQYLRTYTHTTYEMIKLYGVPALLWFGGMGMIVAGHHEVRSIARGLAADIVTGNKFLEAYRARVAKAVGPETEQKIYQGVQEGMVRVVEEDPETGEKKIVEKQANIFLDQPGSMFALNFTNETSDAFDIRSHAEYLLQNRIDLINGDLETGWMRAYSALDICRKLGFNENAFGDNDELLHKFMTYGISGNARKVPDPEMRKLKVTQLTGYQKRWDVQHNMEVYEPCIRLDFNFYPLEGKI